MTEKLAFHQIFRDRTTIDRDECAIGARTLLVYQSRYHALAGTALAGDEYGAVGVCHLGCHMLHLAHRGRVETENFLVDAQYQSAQHPVFCTQPAQVGHLGQTVQQFVVVERLDHVIGRARLDGLDRRVHRSEGGHHDESGIHIDGANLTQQFYAAQSGQLDVAHRNIHITA